MQSGLAYIGDMKTQYNVSKDAVKPGYIAFSLGVSFQISPEVVRDMRDWAAECVWNDSDDLDEMDDITVIRGVNRHYDGGLAAFMADCGVPA